MPLLPILRRLAQGGPPAGMHGPPSGVIPDSAHGGPPPEILASITKAAAAAAAAATSSSSGASAAAASIPDSILSAMPSGMTGPPPGIAIPSGMTGPPPGVIPTGLPTGGTFDTLKHGPPPKITAEMGHMLIGITTMLLVLCIAAVAGRLLSRRMVKQPLGSDDWWSVASLVLFAGLATSEYLIADFNQHMTLASGPPSPGAFNQLGRLKLTSTLMYFFILTAARVSLLFLYKRVFTLRIQWFKIAWWACMVIVSANCFVFVTINLAQCHPHLISSLWTKPWLCRETTVGPAFSGFFNVAIDLTLLVLPVRMVWTLQMGRKQKLAISGVFALGLIGVAISTARAVTVVSPRVFQSGILLFAIWSTVEPAVTLICACLPVMRPLFISIAKIIPSTTSWFSTYLPSSSSKSRSGKPRRKFFGSGSSQTSSSSDEKTLTNNSSISGADKGKFSSASRPSPFSSPKPSFVAKLNPFGVLSRSPSEESRSANHSAISDSEKGLFSPSRPKVETRISAQEVPPPTPVASRSPPPPSYSSPREASVTPPPRVPRKDSEDMFDPCARHSAAGLGVSNAAVEEEASASSPRGKNYHIGNYARVVRDEGWERMYRAGAAEQAQGKKEKGGMWGLRPPKQRGESRDRKRGESKDRRRGESGDVAMGQKAGVCTRCQGDLRQGWE